MSDSRVTRPNMEAIRQAAQERMAAEQRRLAAEQARMAAEAATSQGATADGATRAADTAREAPIQEDLFVREAEVAQSTEAQRQEIYDRVNTDGEAGLSDGEFEHAFAAATIEGAQIAGDRPQPSGTADRAVEVIEGARNSDRETLEQAQAALESLPPEARAAYEGQVQALEEAFDQKWTIPDQAMSTIGQATIDPELPPPGDMPPAEYEAAVVAQAEADQATIDGARQALENVPEHLRDAHASVVGELEQQFEQKWQTPPAETLPAAEGGEGPPETYTIAQGDYLSAIAEEMTGDPGRWQELYEANAEVIGADPNLIHPGQELRIPESWRQQETTVPEAPPEGLETANAAIDEAERRVGEPRHTEAMYAGAPAAQREAEGQLLETAQEAVDALPEGADRETAQARLDGVRQAYETKHGIEPEGGGGQTEESAAVVEENAQAFEESLMTPEELNSGDHEELNSYFTEQAGRLEAIAEHDPERAAELSAQLGESLSLLNDNDVSHNDRVLSEAVMESGFPVEGLPAQAQADLAKTLLTESEGDRPKGEWVARITENLASSEEGLEVLGNLVGSLAASDREAIGGGTNPLFLGRLIDYMPETALRALGNEALTAASDGLNTHRPELQEKLEAAMTADIPQGV